MVASDKDVSRILSDLRDDPLKLGKLLWPDVTFYREQRLAIYSVRDNDETYLPAGNMLGKDFLAGFTVLSFFLTRHPCRIVTTSAKADHLRVLWGEIGRFIQTCKYPLDSRKGGPLVVNHQLLKKIVNSEICPISYVVGMVASNDTIAAMQGHHVAQTGDGIPRTLFVSDESSSVPNEYMRMARTWCNRALVLGNTWPCDNFFKHAIKGKPGTNDKGGDLPRPTGKGYYRKVIRIKAEDSPNVRYALAEIAAGRQPSYRMLVPGVKNYADYQKHRDTLDSMEQCVILDADFYEGKEIRLFPADWLNHSETLANQLRGKQRKAKAIGIDPAEGGDKTAMCAVDELGVIELVSKRTPDTNVVVAEALAFMRKHNVEPEQVLFDRGGGGKEHADRLRGMGYNVRSLGFGEAVSLEPKRGLTLLRERLEQREDRYAYVNRRAEMYGELSLLVNPAVGGFAIPQEYSELHRQLGPLPKQYDSEGRLKLPPKNKRNPDSNEVCLIELLGCSPDEADSLVLAVHALINKKRRIVAG